MKTNKVLIESFLVVILVVLAISISKSASAFKLPSSFLNNEKTDDYDKAYYVNKEDSTASFGKDNFSDAVGIKASLVRDDILTLNNIIDLNDFCNRDESFLEILPVATEFCKADFKRFTVELIDAYDPTNFIKIQVSGYPQLEDTTSTSYFLAAASCNQRLSGFEKTSGRLHVNDQYGEYSVCAFGGAIGADGFAGFFYDTEKKSINCVDYRGIKKEIIDFDEPAYFGTNLWSGFTTNEIYTRVYCDEYVSEKATILVKKYGDFDLSNEKLVDNIKPIINIDLKEYKEEEIPNALVSNPYPIFSASSVDSNDGVVDVDIKVYNNYYSSNKKSITISKNNTFTPQIPIPYYIVYTATDSHNNTQEKVIKVDVLSEIPNISIEFINKVDTICVGDKLNLNNYKVLNALGNAKVNVTCKIGNTSFDVLDYSVRPNISGDMLITYDVEDYVGRTYTKDLLVKVEPATKPTFIEHPVLPRYLIKGNEYVFQSLDAYNYVTQTGEKINTELYVQNKDDIKRINGSYTPDFSGEVDIIYKATVNNSTNEYRVTIPVIDVSNSNGLDMSKYFISKNNGLVEALFDGIKITVNKDDEVSFINYVSSLSFETEFTLDNNYSNTGLLSILLTDVDDLNKQLKFTYIFKDKEASFYINGDEENMVGIKGTLEEGMRFSLNYVLLDNKVYYDISNSNILPIYNYLNGEEFKGFTNNRVYVSYIFSDVKDTSSILLNEINGMYFSDDNQDWIEPRIELFGDYGGEYSIKDMVNIPKIISNDVLSGDVQAYITIVSPSGKYVKTTQNKVLDNYQYHDDELTIILDEYGKYIMTITASDSYNNESSISAILTVVDTEKPTIKLDKEIVNSAKEGEIIDLPRVTIKDNLTESPKLHAYCILPDGSIMKLDNSFDRLKIGSKGTYVIVYLVVDDEGNFESSIHKIIVS